MWRARWREYPGGPQKAKHFERKIDAQRFLTGIEHSQLTGSYVDPAAGRITFRAYAEGWGAVQVHRRSTAINAEYQFRLHVYPVIGDRPIAAIRPTEIKGLVKHLRNVLSPSTVVVVFGRVVAAFKAAVADRIIGRSPCEGIRLGRKEAEAPDEVLSREQVLAQAASINPRYRALIITGAGTGLRPGELFGLTVDRVQFLARQPVIRVDQQLVRVRGHGVQIGPLKTASSYRAVPLPGVVAETIAAHLQRWPAHSELGLVFTNERGGPIQQYPFSMAWETGKGRAGLPGWATPHDLRHDYASLLIRSGASIKVVQRRLGHASAKTTLDTYGHLFPDEDDRTRRAVDDDLGRSGEDWLRTDDASEGQNPATARVFP
jgi:integrase